MLPRSELDLRGLLLRGRRERREGRVPSTFFCGCTPMQLCSSSDTHSNESRLIGVKVTELLLNLVLVTQQLTVNKYTICLNCNHHRTVENHRIISSLIIIRKCSVVLYLLMSVCLSAVCAPNFESLDLETSFSVCRNIYIKFIYQGHQVKVKVTGACVLFGL